VRWNQEHPWGTPENHPGKLGKVAHAFSTLGNIAGDIFAPAVMANIPGTQLNMQQQEGGLAKRLNSEITNEGENQQRAATTGKTQEETNEMPSKQRSEQALQGAQTENLESEVSNRGTDLAHAYSFAVNKALKENRDPGQDPTVMHLQDAIISIQRQPAPKEDASKTIDLLGPDRKEHQMGWNAKTGKYDIDMGQKGEKPTQAPGITMVIPNAEGGGGTVQRLTAGSQVAPGAMSGTQFGSLNTPTTQQRNVGAQAKLVSEQRSRTLISAKGFTLPARAVEREHQLAPTPLAQRRVGDRGLEIADDLCGATGREQRIGPVLDKGGVALDPAGLLGYTARALGQFGGAAPESQGLVEVSHRLAGVSRGDGRAARSGEQLVAGGIDLGSTQGPACALRQHKAVAQGATQSGDVSLQGLGGGARRIPAPEQLDERVGRHDRTIVKPEHREDGARFGARYCDGRTVLPDLERSQNAQFHRWKRTHVCHRR